MELVIEVERILGEEERSARKGMNRAQLELLDFYKKRLDELEKDREEATRRLGVNGLNPRAERRELQSKLISKGDEIRDLQRALSDAQRYLYDERDMVLKLSKENDRLRIQEKEDRKRIQHLLAMAKPIEQQVTFARNKKPRLVARLPKGQKPGKLRPRPRGAPPEPVVSGVLPGAVPSVLRTVVMPNDQTRRLEETIEGLRDQIHRREALFAERAQADSEALEIERAHHDAEIRRLQETAKTREERIGSLETLYRSTVHDLLNAKQKIKSESRKIKEEGIKIRSEIVKVRKETKRQKEVNEKRKIEVEKIVAEEKKKSKAKVYIDLINAQDEVTILREQYQAAQQLWMQRVEHLEGLIGKEKAKRRFAERKCRMDREGYGSEVRLMRQQVRGVERVVTDIKIGIQQIAHGGLSLQEAAAITAQFRRLQDAEGRIRDIRTRMNEMKSRLASEEESDRKHAHRVV